MKVRIGPEEVGISIQGVSGSMIDIGRRELNPAQHSRSRKGETTNVPSPPRLSRDLSGTVADHSELRFTAP